MGNTSCFPLRGAAILAFTLLLPGCIPWPVSMALSGLSYAATGKSIGDHFLSTFAQKDCSVGRAVLDQTDICQNPDAPAIIAEGIDDDWDMTISPASGERPNGG